MKQRWHDKFAKDGNASLYWKHQRKSQKLKPIGNDSDFMRPESVDDKEEH